MEIPKQKMELTIHILQGGI